MTETKTKTTTTTMTALSRRLFKKSQLDGVNYLKYCKRVFDRVHTRLGIMIHPASSTCLSELLPLRSPEDYQRDREVWNKRVLEYGISSTDAIGRLCCVLDEQFMCLKLRDSIPLLTSLAEELVELLDTYIAPYVGSERTLVVWRIKQLVKLHDVILPSIKSCSELGEQVQEWIIANLWFAEHRIRHTQRFTHRSRGGGNNIRFGLVLFGHVAVLKPDEVNELRILKHEADVYLDRCLHASLLPPTTKNIHVHKHVKNTSSTSSSSSIAIPPKLNRKSISVQTLLLTSSDPQSLSSSSPPPPPVSNAKQQHNVLSTSTESPVPRPRLIGRSQSMNQLVLTRSSTATAPTESLL